MSIRFITGRVYLSTHGTFDIQQVIKGEESLLKKTVSYSNNGGKILISDLEIDKSIDWKEWEKLIVGVEIPENERNKTYYTQVINKSITFEGNKQYIVCISYDEKLEEYKIYDLVSGAMEYNPETNMVKNNDTGEFEELDWSLFKQE